MESDFKKTREMQILIGNTYILQGDSFWRIFHICWNAIYDHGRIYLFSVTYENYLYAFN